MDYLFTNRRLLNKNGNDQTAFCAKLRSFLESSIQQQNFFANLEGVYNRRRFDTKDDSFIQEYVYNTLYYNEIHSNVNSSSLNEKESKHCRDVCEKIVSLGKRLQWADEIYLCCVWIYYFDYEMKKGKAVPVFKIYKEETGDAAVFLDVNLSVYDNWDAYLDTAPFPTSILCVPRHGNYTFIEEKLDLEFFCKNAPLENPSKLFSQNFKPFSQSAVRYWLDRFRLLRRKVQDRIIGIATWLINRFEESKVSFSTLAIYCTIFAVKLYDFYQSPQRFVSNFENLTLMLLDIPLKSDSIQSEVKSIEGVTSLTCTECPSFKESLQKLISLCNENTKNWFEILQAILTLLSKAKTYVSEIEHVITTFLPHPALLGVLKVFRVIFSFGDIVGNFLEKEKKEETPPVKSQVSVYSNEKTRKVVHSEVLKTFLEKWDLLERLPAESVEELIVESSNSGRESEPSYPIPLTVVDDVAVVYLPRLSVPTLNDYCLRFIGPNVNIRPVEGNNNEIVLDTEVIGNLCFINDISALGVFKMEKNRKFKMLEGFD